MDATAKPTLLFFNLRAASVRRRLSFDIAATPRFVSMRFCGALVGEFSMVKRNTFLAYFDALGYRDGLRLRPVGTVARSHHICKEASPNTCEPS
jgi:hypothetical protein